MADMFWLKHEDAWAKTLDEFVAEVEQMVRGAGTDGFTPDMVYRLRNHYRKAMSFGVNKGIDECARSLEQLSPLRKMWNGRDLSNIAKSFRLKTSIENI